MTNQRRQINPKIDVRGLPSLLLRIKNEPLNHVISLKVQPSLAEFLETHGGSSLIRNFIIEGLKRELDRPKKAICRKCVNLSISRGQDPFCVVLCAYLDRKLLGQVFSCDYFQETKE